MEATLAHSGLKQKMNSELKAEYEKRGWLGPLPVFSASEIAHYRDCVQAAESSLHLMQSEYRCKSNVLFPWVDEITRHPVLRSYVEQIIGSDFHCWDVLFWIKNPGDGRDVSFHQDATYWNFDQKHKAVSAWLAFDDVTLAQGPIEYVDGSHENQQREHRDVRSESNLLMRGQTVVTEHTKTTTTPMAGGSVMLHSPYVVHGSRPNRSDRVRAACGMIFVSTECKPIKKNSPESTLMIQGEDRFGHMLHDSRPGSDWETNLRNWKRAYDRQHDNYFSLSNQAGV
jgi:non-haem Fe2+, alpha-ketoglutarate-dependent halogenase